MKKITIFLFATCLLLVFSLLNFSLPINSLPDLVVLISTPAKAQAGENISRKIKMIVKNVGNAPAAGTMGDLDSQNGYMIDYVISTDEYVPKRFAVYSPKFHEDALLQGGRRSHTLDLNASDSAEYLNGAVIPKDTPAGEYFICAQVDPGNKVKEENEENNIMCVSVEITNPTTVSEN